jgi:PKD repeat protein
MPFYISTRPQKLISLSSTLSASDLFNFSSQTPILLQNSTMRNNLLIIIALSLILLLSGCQEEPEPIASFTYSPTNLTAPATATFQSTSTNASGLKWFVNDREVSTQKSLTYTFPTKGFYKVELLTYKKSGYPSDYKGVTVQVK